MSVALPLCYLYGFSSLRVLRERCFKAQKIPLDQSFNHWNVHICWFCTKSWLWGNTIWEDGYSTPKYYLFAVLSFRALGKSCFKVLKAPLDEYFCNWKVYFFKFYIKNQIWVVAVRTWLILVIWRVLNAGIRRKHWHWNTGLVPSGTGLTSWGEGASLAFVGYTSSDFVTIKMPYGADVLHWPASHPIFSYWIG